MSPGRRLCFGLWSGEEFLSDETGMVYFCSVSSVVLLNLQWSHCLRKAWGLEQWLVVSRVRG